MKKRLGQFFCGIWAAAVLLLPVHAAAEPVDSPVPLPIIMYHQISTNPSAMGDYTVSPEVFEGDLAYLAAHGYQSVTTQDLIRFTRGEGTLPEKPVLITFDDGYESLLPYALPALERHGMSAVLAVVGSYSDAYTQSEDHNLNYSHFSWPALRELQQSQRIEFAVHTYDMHKLEGRRGCKIKPGESREAYGQALNADLDIIESRFAEYLGEKPLVFAYPYGFFCAEAREILQQRGYQVLFTCEERVNALTGDPGELLNLGRFNRAYGISREQFFSKITG